mgnify:CR=1 FL=1
MKSIFMIAAATALFSIVGTAYAEPVADPHAGHNHGTPPAAATPTPSPAPSTAPDAKGCDHAMPMAGMNDMQGKDGKPMDHQSMADCKMECCEHMMHGGAMPMAPAPSPTPSATPKP